VGEGYSEPSNGQQLQGSLGFVAARRLARSESHARLCGEDIDHVQRGRGFAALVGTTQRLAIDGDDPRQIDPVRLRKCRHEPLERLLESPGMAPRSRL
jgi:hypothetical protein